MDCYAYAVVPESVVNEGRRRFCLCQLVQHTVHIPVYLKQELCQLVLEKYVIFQSGHTLLAGAEHRS
jgi:hypothetical protein